MRLLGSYYKCGQEEEEGVYMFRMTGSVRLAFA
jgi:hypothetical protein